MCYIVDLAAALTPAPWPTLVEKEPSAEMKLTPGAFISKSLVHQNLTLEICLLYIIY